MSESEIIAFKQHFKTVPSSKRKEKINISFTSKNNIFAERIVIQRKNIKLRIELNDNQIKKRKKYL